MPAGFRQPANWGILAVGLVVQALGVALSIVAALGTTPISSLPYVGYLITGFTVGQLTVAMNVAFVALQALILRREFQWFAVTQIGVAFGLGFLIDGWLWIFGTWTPSSYLLQWAVCLAGVLALGIGIALAIRADISMMAGEGLVLALARVLPFEFGTVKIAFDVTLVATSILLGLLVLGRVEGVREGTVVAALLVGYVVRYALKAIARFMPPPSESAT